MTSATHRIRQLADALANPASGSDDLIHAFGDVEQRRFEVAAALLGLIAHHQTCNDFSAPTERQ